MSKALKYDTGKQRLDLLGRNFFDFIAIKKSIKDKRPHRDISLTKGDINIALSLGRVDLTLANSISGDLLTQARIVIEFIEFYYPGSMDAAIDVFEFGAKKYTALNYAIPGMELSRLTAAAKRHFQSHYLGELLDAESNKPHLAHTICCMLMLIEQRRSEQ